MVESLNPARLPTRRIAVCVLLALATAGSPASPVAADERPSLLEVASGYGFSASDVETMLAGKIVFGTIEAVSDNELALSAGTLSKRAVDWHAGQADLIDSQHTDPTLQVVSRLEGDGRASLAKLALDDATLDELMEVEAGEEMNFSRAEITRLREAGKGSDPAARRAAVLDAFREILGERYRAYRDRGLAGLIPYDRGDGEETSAAAQLENAFGELRLTRQLAPTVHGAMASYPADPPEGVQSRFLWMRNEAEGRTLVSLVHVMWGVENDSLVEIIRRYYVDHTLNSMQTVSVTMPVDEGTAVLYANRTSTDLVTGFGSSVAKKIGRFLMRREIGRLVEAFLDSNNNDR
jgi:hypothetical protein